MPSTPGCGLPLPSLEPSFIEGSDGHGSDAGVGDEPKLDTKDEGVLEKDSDGELGVTELAYLAHPLSVRDGNDLDDVDHDAEVGDNDEGQGEGEVEDGDELDDEPVASEYHILPMLTTQRPMPYLLLRLKAFYNPSLITPSANRKRKERVARVALMTHPVDTYWRASLMSNPTQHFAFVPPYLTLRRNSLSIIHEIRRGTNYTSANSRPFNSSLQPPIKSARTSQWRLGRPYSGRDAGGQGGFCENSAETLEGKARNEFGQDARGKAKKILEA
ncbi:hypothetical protein V5O48_011732, partial [Marasmius crinis-equi]